MTPDSNSQLTNGQGSADCLAIFAFCRVETVRAGRLVTGRLLPGLTPESPEVRAVLADWPGSVGAREEPVGWELFLFEPAARRERWWLHILLLWPFPALLGFHILKTYWF